MKNSRETLYGKGDNRRPENTTKFNEGFDRIFGDKSKKAKRDDRRVVRAQKRGANDND